MSPHESQRLLSLLNASFKKQLDREHLADSSSNEHYANLHLQSILTNPLFDAKPRTRSSSSSESQGSGKRLGQQQKHLKGPMDAFKKRVSQGTADLDTARYFLRIQYHYCLASPAATPKEAMQSSGAASTILQWLWSSGMEDTGRFLRKRKFIAYLVPFLVAEDQHSRILGWLHRCNDPEEVAFSSQLGLHSRHIQDFLLKRLIKEEIRIGDGLESAITLFLRIADSPRSSKNSMQWGATKAASLLGTAILRLPKATEIEPSIVRSFLETTRDVDRGPLLSARFCVFLRNTLPSFQNEFADTIVNKSVRQRPHLVLLGLRAAEVFLQDARQNEAHRIMEFLETNFPLELGSLLTQDRNDSVMKESEKALTEEEESLRLLDALTVQ